MLHHFREMLLAENLGLPASGQHSCESHEARMPRRLEGVQLAFRTRRLASRLDQTDRGPEDTWQDRPQSLGHNLRVGSEGPWLNA